MDETILEISHFNLQNLPHYFLIKCITIIYFFMQYWLKLFVVNAQCETLFGIGWYLQKNFRMRGKANSNILQQAKIARSVSVWKIQSGMMENKNISTFYNKENKIPFSSSN